MMLLLQPQFRTMFQDRKYLVQFAELENVYKYTVHKCPKTMATKKSR